MYVRIVFMQGVRLATSLEVCWRVGWEPDRPRQFVKILSEHLLSPHSSPDHPLLGILEVRARSRCVAGSLELQLLQLRNAFLYDAGGRFADVLSALSLIHI